MARFLVQTIPNKLPELLIERPPGVPFQKIQFGMPARGAFCSFKTPGPCPKKILHSLEQKSRATFFSRSSRSILVPWKTRKLVEIPNWSVKYWKVKQEFLVGTCASISPSESSFRIEAVAPIEHYGGSDSSQTPRSPRGINIPKTVRNDAGRNHATRGDSWHGRPAT